MARPRKFLQQDAEYRYYVTVYPPDGGASRRLRMGTKDRARASHVAEVIRPAWRRGDYDECLRRRDRLNEAYDRAYHEFQRVRDEYVRIDDPNGYAEQTDEIEQAERVSEQYDRPISEALLGLHSENLHHDIAYHVQRALDYLSWASQKDLLKDIQQSLAGRLGDDSPKEKPKDRRPKASEHKVFDCLDVWIKRATNQKQSAKHIRHYEKTFTAFAERIGNRPVNRLTKKDIVGWKDHIDETRGDRGARWHKEQLLPIPAVFKLAMIRTDWELPDGLRGWLEIFEYDPHKPRKEHSQPLSPTHYKQLLARAEEWAAIDLDEYAASLPMNGANPGMVKKNNMKQAKRIKRAGTMWAAILRLAANCGCDNTDIVYLTVDDLRMDEALPLFTLMRHKTKIDRVTPLLPSTVDAIRRWQAYEKPKSKRVFSNDAKRPFSSEKVSEGFNRLREPCGLPKGDNGVWFKHLRNVGGTIAKRTKRSIDEREAFRGHPVRGMCRFYEGDVGDDYLVGLVNLLGAEYFDGESVICFNQSETIASSE